MAFVLFVGWMILLGGWVRGESENCCSGLGRMIYQIIVTLV